MAEISAVPVPFGDKEFVGPTHTQFILTGYMKNKGPEILLSPILATSDEVDREVKRLVEEVEKAGKAAKRILEKNKSARAGHSKS
jgi:hypothetical protein